MANRVKITFSSNPTAYYLMSFSVYNVALGYSKWLSKTFITGTPLVSNHVQIGATIADTVANLLANLNANDCDVNASFTASGTDGFYVNLNVPATYTYTNLSDPLLLITSFELETVTIAEPVTLPALNIHNLSIRIFDTYVNERVLIEELAGATACKIDWDGGDDLYKATVVSKLVFNMLVPEADDVYFLHLFSGDEQRYRVEVVAIDTDDNEQLIWQGFLLPDQYNEPYQQVSFFVDFTATDMLASLKGKYLPQWYYQNTFPVAELLTYFLAATGLQQNIITKPGIEPNDPLLNFTNITINLKAFLENNKLKDIHDMLESVVASLGCNIFSYRGYWWLEGINRKHEVTTTCYQFDTTGTRIADMIVAKNVVDCGGSLQPTPLFSALTPYKRVNVNYDAKGSKNLFTDSVAKVADNDVFATSYTTGNYSGPGYTQPEVYTTFLLRNWNYQLNSDFVYLGMVGSQLLWKCINPSSYGLNDYSGYNYTPAMSLNNWIECVEKPYVKPGILYELEVVLKAENINFDANNDDVSTRLKNGELDRLFPFQVFVNNVEKFSNRSGFNAVNLYRYKITDSSQQHFTSTVFAAPDGWDHELTYTLKFTFRVEEEGELKFRLLMPQINWFGGGIGDYIRVGGDTVYKCETLKLTAVEDYDENNDTIAVRPINYTQELDYDIKLSCTQDTSILNTFGLNTPTSADYFKTIARTDTPYAISGWHYYSPNIDLELRLATWKTTDLISKLLFRNGLKANCLLEKVNGDQIPFTSLWVYFNNPVSRMGYLTGYDGYPNIPKDYKYYPSVDADDVLKYMQVEYPLEDIAKRLDWKLAGSATVTTYPKALATALHAVQPEVVYRLEATALKLLFPTDLIGFYFDNEDKNFIPTRLQLDLFNGKTTFTATEAKYVELTDISYE